MKSEEQTNSIPFTYVGGHLITLPVDINEKVETSLIFDTGIGLEVVSKNVSESLCKPTGSRYSGKRMSGQDISVPLVRIPSLRVGHSFEKDVLAGVFELRTPLPEFSAIGGFLSLKFFENIQFTIDFPAQKLSIEDSHTYQTRAKHGVQVPMVVEKDDISVGAFLDLLLPGGDHARVEVDTGSDSLILNTTYMEKLGVRREEASGTRRVKGKDETGHTFTRYFSTIVGEVSLLCAPEFAQRDPEVMFQDIIYDGLVGISFLRSYAVTFDIANSTMVFSKPEC